MSSISEVDAMEIFFLRIAWEFLGFVGGRAERESGNGVGIGMTVDTLL